MRMSFSDKGEKIYRSNERKLIEEYGEGEHVAIDVEEGEIIAHGDSCLDAIRAAKKVKEKTYYLRRIERLTRLF